MSISTVPIFFGIPDWQGLQPLAKFQSLSFKTLPTISNFGNSLKRVYDASYLQFYQLLIDVRTDGRKYTELTAIELQTVENIAQANTYGSIYAESLLAMLNQTTIDRVPHKESTQSNKSAAVNELQSMVQIYPNPMENTVTIESAVKVAKLSVYNITGQFIEQRDLIEGKNDLEMNFPNGTYFFQIQSEQQMITYKVVIAK